MAERWKWQPSEIDDLFIDDAEIYADTIEELYAEEARARSKS